MELLVCSSELLFSDTPLTELFIRYNWVIIMPAELSAAAILIGYWNKAINAAAWITICMVVVFVINMLGAGESTDVW
jgi:amino acid permease